VLRNHVEMKIGRAQLELRDESAETPLYGCQEPGCPVHYASFARVLHRCTGRQCEQARDRAARPLSKDGRLMYLAKVERRKKVSACGDVRSVPRAILIRRFRADSASSGATSEWLG